jgi:hypothetical protein
MPRKPLTASPVLRSCGHQGKHPGITSPVSIPPNHPLVTPSGERLKFQFWLALSLQLQFSLSLLLPLLLR